MIQLGKHISSPLAKTQRMSGLSASESNADSRDDLRLQLIILFFGIFEVCVGVFSYIAADYLDLFGVLVVISAAMAAVSLLFCLLQPKSVKIYDILAMALMLAYGIGSFNTWFTFLLEGSISQLSYYVSEPWLARTLASVCASAGFLHVIGRLDHHAYIFNTLDIKKIQYKKILALAVIGLLFELYFVLTGRISFMATLSVVDGGAQISPTATLFFALMTPLGALAIYASFSDQNSKRRLYLILIAICLLMVQFLMGRRIFVFSVIIYIMTIFFVSRPKKILSIKNISLLLLVVVFLKVTTTAFYTIRLASWSLNDTHKRKHDTSELLSEAYKLYTTDNKGEVDYQIKQNIKTRTFVLEYLGLLTQRESVVDPLYGQNFQRAVVVSTPVALYPSKYKNRLFLQEETLANPHFRFPDNDDANTILTGGLIDFGFLGLLLYPALICLLFSMAQRFCRNKLPSEVTLLIGLSTCQIMLSVEADLAAYISGFRNNIFLLLVFWLIFAQRKPLFSKKSLNDSV